jgi:hypothetical protein
MHNTATKPKARRDSPHISRDFLDLENITEQKHDNNLHACHEKNTDVNDAHFTHVCQWENTGDRRYVHQVENLRENEHVKHKAR